MWLTLSNLNAKLATATDDERRWLSEYLSFDEVFFNGKRRIVGKKRMFSEFSQTFPAGFTEMVVKAAAKEGFAVELIDKRTKPCDLDEAVDLSWLRDYQQAAIAAVDLHTRGIIWAPTGSGKGSMVAGLVQALPCRWLYLVHRTTLIHQQADRIEEQAGVACARIGEGKWEGFGDDKRVVCASFQSVYSAMRRGNHDVDALLEGAQALAVDEAHCQPSETFMRVSQATPNAYYRVGLSGTPLARGDKRSVMAIATLGSVIYRVKTNELVERGILAKPKVYMLPVTQFSDKPTWQGVYGECIVRSRTRNATIVSAVKQAEKPCMVFVKEVKHGVLLEKMLGKAGLSVAFVYGAHSTAWRQSHVKRLEQGGFDVIVASVVFQEGVDIPDLRSVVVASGGKSIIATLQRIGRGMRVAAGKTHFEVYDIDDRGCALLERHTRQRLRAYVSEGHEIINEQQLLPGAG